MERRQIAPAAPVGERAVFGPLRRRWYVVALVFIVVAGGALWQYAGPSASSRQMYVARQAMRIVVLPSGEATTYDEYLATQQDAAIARALASGSALANPTLDTAILARVPAYLPHPYSSTTSSSLLTSTTIGQALSATNSGSVVVLAARWSSVDTATALVKAAREAIIHTDLTTLLAGVSLPATSLTAATVSLSPIGAARQPTLDAAAESTAQQVAIGRLALGLLAGLLFAYVVDWFAVRGSSSHMTLEAKMADEA